MTRSPRSLPARLSERAGGEITLDDVLDSTTIEELADVVRQYLEDDGKIDGLVRTLRARPEGSTAVPVFVFHAAGGSTVTYEPLLKRLPAGTPMYGFERVEGSIETRAAAYVPLLREIQGDGPYVLCGWSFGGVMSYAVAKVAARAGRRRACGRAARHRHGRRGRAGPPRRNDASAGSATASSPSAPTTWMCRCPLDVLASTEADEDQIQILMDMIKMSGAKIPRRHHRASADVVVGQSRHPDGRVQQLRRRRRRALHGRTSTTTS